jgi:predicted MFS family arabinose efflux permease
VLAFAAFVPIERRAVEPIIPFSLFRSRTITATSVLLCLFGISMFGLILYTPLFVQGVLGQSASSSGAVMIPMVMTMTVMGIVVGQLIARFGNIRTFLLLGTGVMCLGVMLLATLHAGSSPFLVAAYLFVSALGMGTVMPVTTLAVQMAVEPRALGVAMSATQFIRSIGSTVGTAVIGTLVTGGYVARLTAHTPPGVPAQAVTALHSPNALVDPESLQRLAQLMAQVPNGADLLQALLAAARVALAGAIQRGFLLTLGTTLLAFGCCFLIGKLRLSSNLAPMPQH